MQIVNASGFEVAVSRIDLGKGYVAAVAIVKATFNVDANGGLAPSAEPMPLVR
jgi:hypothetical protein